MTLFTKPTFLFGSCSLAASVVSANSRKELNREEERYTEAIRIAEERRLAELERIRYQAEWDKTPLYIKPIKFLVDKCRSKSCRQGKKHRKSHKKSKRTRKHDT